MTHPLLHVAHRLLVVVAEVGEEERLEERRQRLRPRHRRPRRPDHGHDERALRRVTPAAADRSAKWTLYHLS